MASKVTRVLASDAAINAGQTVNLACDAGEARVALVEVTCDQQYGVYIGVAGDAAATDFGSYFEGANASTNWYGIDRGGAWVNAWTHVALRVPVEAVGVLQISVYNAAGVAGTFTCSVTLGY